MKYTPTLEVSSCSEITKVRELPTTGEVLVNKGVKVTAEQVVLRAELPGEIEVVRLGEGLGVEVETVPALLKVAVGSAVKKGDVLAETTGLFGFFKQQIKAPVDGTIEYFTDANAHMAIRPAPTLLEVKAYLPGEIIGVQPGRSVTIRADASIIQGVFGLGGERFGEICVLDCPNDSVVTAEVLYPLRERLSGKVLVGGSSFSVEALQLVEKSGASAVVTGSITSNILAGILGYELGVSITGDEKLPYTLIVTEGFGTLPISSRVTELARKLEGKPASVNGATQVRAGAMRPEVIVVDSEFIQQQRRSAADRSAELAVGSLVRVLCYPYYGELGEVRELPHKPEIIPCGAIVRVLRITVKGGEQITIPRSNVELL